MNSPSAGCTPEECGFRIFTHTTHISDLWPFFLGATGAILLFGLIEKFMFKRKISIIKYLIALSTIFFLILVVAFFLFKYVFKTSFDFGIVSDDTPLFNSNIFKTPDDTLKTVQLNTKILDSSDLVKVFKEIPSNKLQECHSFDGCFDSAFSLKTKQDLAAKYNIADNLSSSNDLNIGLIKGKSADIPGIGSSYMDNKKYLNLEDNSWYWEIGACSTNKRVFINAVTGKAGPVHSYVYCGGVY